MCGYWHAVINLLHGHCHLLYGLIFKNHIAVNGDSQTVHAEASPTCRLHLKLYKKTMSISHTITLSLRLYFFWGGGGRDLKETIF